MAVVRLAPMLGLLAAAMGFSLQPTCSTELVQHHRAARSSVPQCVVEDGSFSRRAALAGIAGLAIGAGSRPVSAGFVTSLGIETTKPEDADIDQDLLKSTKVQDSLKSLATYKTSAVDLSKKFDADTNIALIPSIRKDFDFGKLRDDLNVASTVFDDNTQLTIDRISRSILYDLTELENASRFKKGEDQTRTPKKVANVQKWFVKLDTDLGGFLKYFS